MMNQANNPIDVEKVIDQKIDEELTYKQIQQPSGNKYQEFVESSNDWIWEVNAKAQYVYSNSQVKYLLGYEPEEIIGKTLFDFMAPEESRRISKILMNLMNVHEPIVLLENINIHKNKQLIILETSGVPLFDESGTFYGYHGINRDITARKKAEEQNKLLSELVDTAPSSFIVHDFEGKILYANQRSFEMHGYKESEFMELNIYDLDIPESQQLIQARSKEINEKNEARFEVSHYKKDRTIFPLLIHAKKSLWGDKSVILSIGTDLTERKQIEKERLKNRNLESVGVLAGGIAHDFNNLLTGIFGNIELAKLVLPIDHEVYEYLESAQQSMDRATELTAQLLTFAKGGYPIKNTFFIGAVIIETAQFSLHGSKCKLLFDISPNLNEINADKGQISQVISNLVINAQQAMPNGGIITITVNNIVHQGKKHIKIIVQDEGIGIDPKYIDKIFDPYFTTKISGNGLGLAITYSIIKRHNGNISVKSVLNKGTAFTILIPISKQPI